MKLTKLFYALGIGCMLCACTSNDDLAPDQKGETGGNANYISIAIVTANENGTRATDNDYDYGKSDLYDPGTDKENAVNSLRLYFFDQTGNCVYQKNFSGDDLKKTTPSQAVNPAVSTLATIEVELTANRDYHSVVALINPATTSTGEEPNFDKLSDLKANTTDYATLAQGGKIENGGNMPELTGTTVASGKFTMSNSLYYPTDKYTTTIPEGMSPVVEVPIYSSNIYTHVEIDKIEDANLKATKLADLQKEKAINIYVERVCAKVTAKNKHDFNAHFVDKDGTTKKIKVIMDNSGTEKEIEVLVDFKGMDLTVMANTARVIKHRPDGLSFEFCQHVGCFYWNNPVNFRTHWEEAGGSTETDYKYTSWKTVKDAAITTTDFVKYINPNTQDPTNHVGDESDFTTKLIVCAQLYFMENGVKKELDLVKFSDGFWLPSKLITHAANRVVENLPNVDLSSLNDAEKALAQAAIENVTVEKLTEVKGDDDPRAAIYLHKAEGDHDYLAELVLQAKEQFNLFDGLTVTASKEEQTNVSNLLRANINATLNDLTNREIQYWKNGMTYFYVPIRHEGFPGLLGEYTIDNTTVPNYLNGVVRNHSYNIEITKVYGLGTPVVDPDEPIDPERPKDAPASYITAKIHVLKWRMVNSKLTLH